MPLTSKLHQGCFYNLFEYCTPKIVIIKNKKVAVLNRLIQLSIVIYVVGFAILWNKGYQKFNHVDSAVITKLKGTAYTNFSESEFNELVPDTEVYRRIWDTADYVVPPSENHAFFVVTNIVISANQTQRTCPENPNLRGARCNSSADCQRGIILFKGNGVFTGECVTSDINDTVSVCEIIGWCPVERNINPLKGKRALLTSTKKFTVLIKNFVEFPSFKVKRRNIPDVEDEDYLKECTYHPIEDSLCPVFVLEDIVPGNYDELAVKGAAIAIIIDWSCNLDYDESECFPTYKFRRLDPHAMIAPGLNFRYAHYYGDSQRTLYKAYGMKFIIMVQGRGGKFGCVNLLTNIGAGVGLLAVATFVCDKVVLWCLERKEEYKAMIYESANVDNVIYHPLQSEV